MSKPLPTTVTLNTPIVPDMRIHPLLDYGNSGGCLYMFISCEREKGITPVGPTSLQCTASTFSGWKVVKSQEHLA